jgi:hypothetical protein
MGGGGAFKTSTFGPAGGGTRRNQGLGPLRDPAMVSFGPRPSTGAIPEYRLVNVSLGPRPYARQGR